MKKRFKEFMIIGLLSALSGIAGMYLFLKQDSASNLYIVNLLRTITLLFPAISFVIGSVFFLILYDHFEQLTKTMWQSISVLASTLLLSSLTFDSQYSNLLLNSALAFFSGIQHIGIRFSTDGKRFQKTFTNIIIILFCFGIAAGTLMIVYCNKYTLWSSSTLCFSCFYAFYTFSLGASPNTV